MQGWVHLGKLKKRHHPYYHFASISPKQGRILMPTILLAWWEREHSSCGHNFACFTCFLYPPPARAISVDTGEYVRQERTSRYRPHLVSGGLHIFEHTRHFAAAIQGHGQCACKVLSLSCCRGIWISSFLIRKLGPCMGPLMTSLTHKGNLKIPCSCSSLRQPLHTDT